MRVTPDAIPDDGLFDITLIKALSKLNITLSFPLLYAGKIRFHPKASTFRAERVFIDTQLPLDIHLDGEVSGHTPVSFSILKHAIDVIAPW